MCRYCLETNNGKMVIWDSVAQITDSSFYMGHVNGMHELLMTRGALL